MQILIIKRLFPVVMYYSILLVTTGQNRVSDILSKINCRSTVIDCSAFRNRTEFLNALSNMGHFDIMVTFRCPYFVPPEIYGRAGVIAVNIHPSLLPQYAGVNPWQSMKAAKETKGGVTLHYITDKIDAGKVIEQRCFTMDLNYGIEDARNKSEQIAAEILLSFLMSIPGMKLI